MNFNWKHTTGALALSVAMLSMSATAQVAPAVKPVKAPVEEVVQPAPSVDVETGQLLDKGPRWPKVVEKTSGTPPPVDDAAAPDDASARKIETGQLLIKDKPIPSSAQKTSKPKAKGKASSSRPVKKGPGECIAYTINKYGKKVCSKTKVDNPG